METETEFIFSGSKITEDGDCSHEIKRRKVARKVMTNLDNIMTNLDNILKNGDITLPKRSI